MSAVEGEQFAHPDSPEGKRQIAEAIEQERDEFIARARATARDDLAAIRSRLSLMKRQLARLDESDLYDVEYADGGGPEVVASALGMVAVALSAIAAVIPAEDA